MLSHTSGQQIDLVSFDVTNMPTTGTISFLDNSSSIAMDPAFGGGLNSFYNSDIDNSGVANYFSGYVAGSDSFMFSTLGLEDNTLPNNDISVYPNPTSDVINISSNLSITSLELFNILGKKVMQSESVTNRLVVSELPSGIYLLNINTEKGNLTKKVIIE